jgi:hypothetical protein
MPQFFDLVECFPQIVKSRREVHSRLRGYSRCVVNGGVCVLRKERFCGRKDSGNRPLPKAAILQVVDCTHGTVNCRLGDESADASLLFELLTNDMHTLEAALADWSAALADFSAATRALVVSARISFVIFIYRYVM